MPGDTDMVRSVPKQKKVLRTEMCLLLNTAAIKRQKLMFFQHSRRVCRVSNLNQLFREFFWWSAAWFCSKWWLVAVNFLFLSLLFPQERPEANNYQSCFFFWRFLILLHEGIFCSIIYKKKKFARRSWKRKKMVLYWFALPFLAWFSLKIWLHDVRYFKKCLWGDHKENYRKECGFGLQLLFI